MKQVGLSALETSFISGLMPFIGALVRPIFGGCADKFQRHKTVLMFCCIASGLLHICLLFVPSFGNKEILTVNMICQDNKFAIDFHSNNSASNCAFESDTDLNYQIQNLSQNTHEACFLSCMYTKNTTELSPCVENADQCRGINNTSIASFVKNESINFSINVESLLETISGTNQSECIKYKQVLPTLIDSEEFQGECLNKARLLCKIHCSNSLIVTLLKDGSKGQESRIMFGQIFLFVFLIYLVAQIAYTPVVSLLDAVAYDYLAEDRLKWGNQRVWGTIGFSFFAILSTLYMDVFATAEHKNYTASFILFAVNSVIAAISVCKFQLSDNVISGSMLKNLFVLLSIPEVLSVALIVLVFGIYQGVVETFLFWHLQTLGSTQILFGLCIVMNCIPEIFTLILAGRILRTIGYTACMTIVFIVWFVRLFAYSYLSNPWWVLAIEPLHSVTYGLMYACASSYGSKVAPTGMHGTIQGLLGGLHFGFGELIYQIKYE